MNPTVREQPWGPRRWRFVIGFLVMLQLGVTFFFGAKQLKPVRNVPRKSVFRALPGTPREHDLAEFLEVEDPTLFGLPNAHGFSGPAWLHQPSFAYQLTNWTEPPEWLQLETGSLGELLKFGTATNTIRHREELSGQPLFHPELVGPKPVYESKLLIDPDLLQRWTGPTISLKAQPWADVLEPTQIQVGIDQEGMVLSARIWRSSGSKQADADALRVAKTLLFQPLLGQAGVASIPRMTWGKLTFRWFTVPLQK